MSKMIGSNKDKEFDEFGLENYEEFYENHRFVQTPEDEAINIHEIIPRFSWAFDQIEEYKPESLLDLGTLDGSFPITVSKHLGIPCVGVDLTKDGISIAKERSKRLGLPCEFYQGTVEEWLIKFKKEGRKFGALSAFELLEHVKDPKLLLSLIDGVLQPGGFVLVSTPAYESPLYGKDDEKNKCHIRLYTTEPEDYESENKFGNVRKATSIVKEIGPDRIKDMDVFSQLINVRYE